MTTPDTSLPAPLPRRRLGVRGPEVSALGLGCMGMSDFYAGHTEATALATLDAALDAGVTLFDTADMYGPHTNEQLLGRWLRGAPQRRSQVFIATKFGIVRSPDDPQARGVDGRPEYVRKAVEGSLARLGIDTIDLYYQHRVDPQVPVEETMGALAGLVAAGKVRYLGLCEVSAATLARAHAVHPVTAVQSEYSLWTRDPEDGVLAACARLGCGFVPYSPLGRGFLTGALRSPEDFAPDDYRRHSPRFQGENFARNLRLVDEVRRLATARGVTAAQLALAWVLAQGPHIVPIFGTTRPGNLRANLAALALTLDDETRQTLERVFPRDAAAGLRYPQAMMGLLNA